MKILTFSSLFPSTARPTYALFVETRLKELLKHGHVEAIVIAPVPWFPFGHRLFVRYAGFAATPREETRAGVRVFYPRFLPLPGLNGALKSLCMAAAAIPLVRNLRRSGYQFDLIDAHYFYPDGVAAALLAAYLRVPLVITARGSDLNLHARSALPRRLIRWAARRASAIVTVSNALREVAASIGIEPTKLRVLRNGVDLDRFRAMNRMEIRKRLGVDGPVLLSVGNLVEEKGHELVIRALPMLPDTKLLIVGGGPEHARLTKIVRELRIGDRVQFVGAVEQDRLPDFYNAADVLVLASSREGWPNVLLEAMACGTPVIASRVGGCPEIVTSPDVGSLLEARTPEAIARAVLNITAKGESRDAIRKYAQRFDWDETSLGQLSLFSGVLAAGDGASGRSTQAIRFDA